MHFLDANVHDSTLIYDRKRNNAHIYVMVMYSDCPVDDRSRNAAATSSCHASVCIVLLLSTYTYVNTYVRMNARHSPRAHARINNTPKSRFASQWRCRRRFSLLLDSLITIMSSGQVVIDLCDDDDDEGVAKMPAAAPTGVIDLLDEDHHASPPRRHGKENGHSNAATGAARTPLHVASNNDDRKLAAQRQSHRLQKCLYQQGHHLRLGRLQQEQPVCHCT